MTSASIAEGEVDEVGPGGTITYPDVTSCLAVTVYLRDGGKVGAHAGLYRVPGKYHSDEILPALTRAVGNRRVDSVDVSGAVEFWNPAYFEKAIPDLAWVSPASAGEGNASSGRRRAAPEFASPLR